MGKKLGIIIAIAVVVCVAMGAGAWWWVQQQTQNTSAKPTAPAIDVSQASYVTLEKVVVMLRSETPRTHNAYLAADLVFRTDKTHEKAMKAELPMLKGVAVQTLSRLDVDKARAMTIEEWAALLQGDLVAAYDEHPQMRLFDRVTVSRLIIE